MPKTDQELRAIRDFVALVGRLSDSLVRVGPFSLGIDGVLSWIQGVGEIYGALAGGFIVLQGARAGVPLPVLAGAALLVGSRTVISGVPIAGAAVSDIYTAHKWAAQMIVKAIDRKLGESSPGGAAPVWRGRQAFA